MKLLEGKLILEESKYNIVKGKSLEDYMSVYGDAYNKGDLWDIDPKDLKNGALEPRDDIDYWEIDGRYYEAPKNESLKEDKEEEETLPDVVPEEPIVVSTEAESEVDEVLEENAIVSLINSLLKDEFEAIDGYTSAISTLTIEDKEKYEDAIKVLSDISLEENVHVGQLQEILKLVSSNAEAIEQGKEEAKEIIEQEPEIKEE